MSINSAFWEANEFIPSIQNLVLSINWRARILCVLAIKLSNHLPFCKKIFQPPWAGDIDFRYQILWFFILALWDQFCSTLNRLLTIQIIRPSSAYYFSRSSFCCNQNSWWSFMDRLVVLIFLHFWSWQAFLDISLCNKRNWSQQYIVACHLPRAPSYGGMRT